MSNTFQLSAGILQHPGITTDPAITWGGLGSFIGHEITHAFDNNGRQFDANGHMGDWWTKADTIKYKKQAGIIEKQFSSYRIKLTTGQRLSANGKKTLNENLADLGGDYLAYHAFSAFLQKHPQPIIHGFTPEQRFFLGIAQFLNYKSSDEDMLDMVKYEEHSPWHLRVNGPLSQLSEFRHAFNIAAGKPMAIPNSSQLKSHLWG